MRMCVYSESHVGGDGGSCDITPPDTARHDHANNTRHCSVVIGHLLLCRGAPVSRLYGPGYAGHLSGRRPNPGPKAT